VALRRTKATLGEDGRPLVALPPLTVSTLRLHFAPDDKVEYLRLMLEGRLQLAGKNAAGFQTTLRLRRFCNHPSLVASQPAEPEARRRRRLGDRAVDGVERDTRARCGESPDVRAACANGEPGAAYRFETSSAPGGAGRPPVPRSPKLDALAVLLRRFLSGSDGRDGSWGASIPTAAGAEAPRPGAPAAAATGGGPAPAGRPADATAGAAAPPSAGPAISAGGGQGSGSGSAPRPPRPRTVELKRSLARGSSPWRSARGP